MIHFFQKLQTKILNTENKINIAKNSFWLILDYFIKIGLSAFVGIWLARYLGPLDFGKLSYTLALIGLFAPLSRLGLHITLPRELIHREKSKYEILSSAFLLKFMGGVLISVLSVIMAFLFHFEDRTIFFLTILVGFSYVFRSFDVFEIWFLTDLKSKFSVIARNISLITSSLLKIIFILGGFSLLYFGMVIPLEAFIFAIVLIVLFVRLEYQFSPTFSLSESFSLLKISWVFLFINILHVILFRIDKVMIENMLGSYEVGLYSISTMIILSFLVFANQFVKSAFPVLIRLEKTMDFKRFSGDLQKFFNYLALSSYGIIIAVFISADQVVNLLWGQDYVFSAKILSVQVVAILFIFSGILRNHWAIVKNFKSFLLLSFFLGAGLNIVLNYYFINIWGAIGAAYSTLISYFFIYIFSGFFFTEIRPILKMQLKALFLVDYLKIVYFRLVCRS